jgi:T5SS/PEP-CTERM-associated repeat protein/autotransporter-associated beta strand protein
VSVAQTWFGGEGTWDNKDNWDPKEVPTASSIVDIDGTAKILGISAGSHEAHLGYLPGKGGSVEVKAPGAVWGNTLGIYLGAAESATGSISIELGGKVATGGAFLAPGVDSSAQLKVSGQGSLFSSNSLTVGYLGKGMLTIEDGAKLQSDAVVFGFGRGSMSLANLTGAGSLMQVTDRVNIGYDGNASVALEKGAQVTSGELIIGGGNVTSLDLIGQGHLAISGKNTSWASSGRLVLGGASAPEGPPSSGTLSVQDGAKFSAAGTAAIGLVGSGSVVVEGAGSQWSAAGAEDTFIGQAWQGSFFVRNGGKATVASARTIIGSSSGSSGELLVSGPGSSFTSNGLLIVGVNGTAKLTVDNGGKVSAAQVTVGGQNNTTGVFVPDTVYLNGGDTPQSRGVLETALFTNTVGDIQFDGGILRATAAQFNFIQPLSGRPLQIGPHGAFIDTNGFAIGLERPFSGAGGLTKLGEGTLTLMQFASTYLGATVIEQGTLQIATQFPTVFRDFLPTGTALIIGNAADTGSATFNLNGVNQQVGSLSSVGTHMSRVVTNTASTHATLTVNQTVDTTFAGQIAGNLSLTKLGAGTLSLTGTNTYTGLTSVNEGTLKVDGSIAGDVVVAAGAVLSGHGSVGGLTLASGAVLSPGGSPGILTVGGDLALSGGSTYLVDLAGTTPGSEYDQAIVLGHVSLADVALKVNLGFRPAAGDAFEILLNEGMDAVAGNFLGLPEGATFSVGSQLFTISYLGGTGNDVVLKSIATVPEPSMVLIWFAGLLMAACTVRYRAARSANPSS